MAKRIPQLMDGWLHGLGAPEPAIAIDSPAWQAWLHERTTVSFGYPIRDVGNGDILGWMTVRKQPTKQRYLYWAAYRRIHGTLRKHHVGITQAVTGARLAVIAERFRQEGAGERATAATSLRATEVQHRQAQDATAGLVVPSVSAVQWEGVTPLPTMLENRSLDGTKMQPHSMDNIGSGSQN